MVEDHRKALARRRYIDLTSERNLLWMDGEGDLQWADIYEGTRVAIPRTLNEYRVTHNLLRPIVANAVAYHCTKPLRFIAEARLDAQAQQQAIIDAAVINFIFKQQRANSILAQVMWLAMGTGWCPAHATWRDDLGFDPYEPLYLKPEETAGMRMPRKGLVDFWVGNPFDTTFNAGAKRGSYHTMRYGRVLPAQQVRDHFGVDVEGTDKLPSASIFQRVASKWNGLMGLNQHGSSIMQRGQGGEELIAIVCEEVAPGTEAEYPDGRLSIAAINGAAETSRTGQASGGGRPVHLTTIPLPSRRFSSTLFYSDQRFGDVHSAPWVSPLVQLQGELNQLRSKEKEYIWRMVEAPTLYSGELSDQQTVYNGYVMLEVQPNGQGATFQPRVMEIPSAAVAAMQQRAEKVEQGMYTIGGYQAASRGEGQAGDPFSKTAFLAEQDDTVHGPTNQDFRFSCEDFAQLAHAVFADNADVAWLLDNAGNEFEMLGEVYIDRSKVSRTPPQFRVVSGFGATNELKGRQLQSLVTTAGADGQPLMLTSEFRQQYPDGSLFDRNSDPMAAQKRRAKTINANIRKIALALRQQRGVDARGYGDPQVQALGLEVANLVYQMFPPLPTDDAASQMAARAEMNQDETEDAVARVAALASWQSYQQWSQMMALYAAQTQAVTNGALNPQQQGQQGQRQAQGGANSFAPQTDPVALAQEQGVKQPEDPAMMQGAV